MGACALLLLSAPAAIKEVARGDIALPFFHTAAPVRMLFVGDIMLDRAVAEHAEEAGDAVLFKNAAPLFAGRDLIVGNLEGTITDNSSISRVDNSILRFTFSPRMAGVLADAGIGAVSLANNHALDFGESGFNETLNYLDQQNIASFGSPLNSAHIATQVDVRGKKICLVGYHQLFDPNPTSVLAKLNELAPQCDYTVLMAHWGVEYSHEPTQAQQELAHQFIDAGADVVIGGHPHVVEPVEIYNSHAIFYSLGNFIFDQGWMSDVRRGAAVTIDFSDTKTTFTVVPVETYLGASLGDGATNEAVLQNLKLDSPTFVLEN